MIQQLDPPQLRRWSKAEYYRLGELGFFDGQHVELWEGEIVVMSPQGPLHYSRVQRVTHLLERLCGTGFDVRMQGPIDLGQHSEPEPDIAVVPAGDYSAAHPRGALLIIEVCDSSLSIDRNRKASLYARAGVADYWIVNVVDDQLEVYRSPQPDSTQAYGHSYAGQTILHDGDFVSPLAAPQLSIPVTDLLG